MAQHGFRTWALGGFGFSGWGVTGSPGWFQNSGEFAMEMGMFLPLVLVYLRAFREDWSHGTRFFFYLLIIMVVGSIIGCSNRGAIIGLITVGLWWLLFSQKRIKALIILISAASIIYLALPKEFKARFETIGKDTTSIARIAYWNASLNAIKENFYLGIGFKNWPIWVSSKHPELKDFDPWGRIIVLHNTYLEVATELGLFGTSAFVLILLQIFFINLRSIRISREQKDPFLEATAKGLIGSLLAYLAPSFFMSVLYYPYVWILLALSICVSSVLQQKKLELGVNHLTGNYR
jgi:O-antigen ligase